MGSGGIGALDPNKEIPVSHFVVMCLVPNSISPLSQHIEEYLGDAAIIVDCHI